MSEWSEVLRLRFVGGYGSVFGDWTEPRAARQGWRVCGFGNGAQVEADLCQYCVKELLGPFCRVLPAPE